MPNETAMLPHNRIFKEIRPIAFNAAERQDDRSPKTIIYHNNKNNNNKNIETKRIRRLSI